ncbi:MAG: energy transducer TonB [Deltaproteobacteria bacterium]|nr:energy transducer TonB [Deltaproteobacteria bacterium]
MALGLAAALMVAQPQRSFRVVQVTLMQQATPLPMRQGEPAGKSLAPEERTASVSQALPQPKPKPAAKPLKAVTKPKPKMPEHPAEITQPPQAEALVHVAAMDSSTSTELGVETRTPANVNEGSGAKGSEGGRSSTKAGNGGGGNSGIVARPDYGVNPKPPYPLLARRLGAQGVVLLRVEVREDGSVAAVELERSSGFSVLDDSATRTVRESWRFVPARIDGTPTASWVEVPIRFVLADS